MPSDNDQNVVSESFSGREYTGEWQTMRFHIRNFSNLDKERNKAFFTEKCTAHGYNWFLELHPRGDSQSNANTVYVSCYLRLDHHGDDTSTSSKPTTVWATCKIRSGEKTFVISPYGFGKDGWGWANWVERDVLLDPTNGYIDEHGTLTIEVDVDLAVENKKVWYPTITRHRQIASRINQRREDTDIVFSVNKAKYNIGVNIVALYPSLNDLIIGQSNGEPIELSGVDEGTFDVIHDFLHTVVNPNELAWQSFSGVKNVLLASDRFGCVELKLYAEAVLVVCLSNQSVLFHTIAGLS
jgi:hypothetical protein